MSHLAVSIEHMSHFSVTSGLKSVYVFFSEIQEDSASDVLMQLLTLDI